MASRRDFLKTGSFALAGLSLGGVSKLTAKGKVPAFIIQNDEYKSRRPAPGERKFISKAIDDKIAEMKRDLKDKKLAWIFENCFPNTLDTTVKFQILNGKPDTFVITGDINAMWLRDSSAQVWPYLPFVNKDSKLKEMLAGVINRQTKCILIDPYANAFNYGPTGSYWDSDLTKMKPELHERKWEVDSLCYPIRLAYGYWKTTGDTSCFDDNWLKAMKLVLQTFKQQQRKHGHGPYKFERKTTTPYGTLADGGYGNPIKPVGLICSMFRPSDDATIFPFLVPSNYFAVQSLMQLSEMAAKIKHNDEFAGECKSLAEEVREALNKYAVSNHLNFGDMIPYEVDGFGNQLFMDDANVPSLLSLPYLGCITNEDKLYQNTRKFVLSGSNPYYFNGTAGEGVGSPHTPRGNIWPISIIIRALTSTNDDEIRTCIKTLRDATADTGFMHESFTKDNPSDFTRKWFAWANTLFGEMILKIHKEKPYLLKD